MIGRIAALIALLLAALLFVQFVSQKNASTNSNRFSDKVNLALRRTAHFLLVQDGDTTSRIPTVLQTQANVWLVRLERTFDYDRLPSLLQESFDLHEIRQNYDVAVIDCSDGNLQLGYNFLDYSKSKVVPCGGRALDSGCYNLKVTFAETNPSLATNAIWWGFVLGCGCVAGIFFLLGRNSKPIQPDAPAIEYAESGFPFGNSRLDVANQTLISNGVRHDLTYREAKLLHLFATHSNQLLERDLILKSVWEDEGIIVGRSIDVFVSRLRKLLRDDPAVQIVAVHGVGYRLRLD